ncbi:uncharacterized protein LOC121238256 [Juglans microcarpa x Juglans regia]|uniref:uncharacterized protein LOC121238256 n=1 Tax=Juglans microcarpa x Juglans regia TaxID=2249226 RepID=UPI001B7E2024|nr:uncharacterized protein LOC121238256 [Juglans microcarpa x Juglans regia]
MKGFEDIMEELFDMLETKEVEEFSLLSQKIWTRRNDFVFKGAFTHPNMLMHHSLLLLQEFQQAPQGVYKLNWDASVDKLHCKVGVGAIIRDWEGSVIATLRINRDLYPDPLLAEELAALRAVIFYKDLGLKKVIVEGDALQVVKRIQKLEVDDTCFGMFISEIIETLASFDQWSVNHIGRDCNKAAHALSKDVLGVIDVMIDLEKFPQCIHSFVKAINKV